MFEVGVEHDSSIGGIRCGVLLGLSADRGRISIANTVHLVLEHEAMFW